MGELAPTHDKVWCYGHGSGDLPRAILSRQETKKLAVIVLSQELYDSTDHGYASDPRCMVVHGSTIDRVYEPCTWHPVDVRVADASCFHLRDRLLARMNRRFNDCRFRALEGDHAANVATNAARRDPSALGLRNRRPAIILAGGPTLSDQYEWVRSQNATKIAMTTTLRPLIAAGIKPDIVCVLDPHPALIDHITDTDTSMRLVYDLSVNPDVISTWRGSRYVAKGLWSDGSVIHMAMDLAVKMGAPKITLCGADMCFPSNRSHVDGVSIPRVTGQPWMPWTVDGYGRPVQTAPDLAQYHRSCELYICAHQHVRWYKRGRDGVEMKGCEWDG